MTTFYINQAVPSRGLKIKSEKVFIMNCQFGQVSRAGIISDASSVLILDNSFDTIKTHSFAGINDIFNFSGNRVLNIEDDAFQISAREIDISNNIFGAISGEFWLFLGPIGPLELGLSVGLSVCL